MKLDICPGTHGLTSLVRLQKGSAMGMWHTPGGLVGCPSYSVWDLFVVLANRSKHNGLKVIVMATMAGLFINIIIINLFKTLKVLSQLSRTIKQFTDHGSTWSLSLWQQLSSSLQVYTSAETVGLRKAQSQAQSLSLWRRVNSMQQTD